MPHFLTSYSQLHPNRPELRCTSSQLHLAFFGYKVATMFKKCLSFDHQLYHNFHAKPSTLHVKITVNAPCLCITTLYNWNSSVSKPYHALTLISHCCRNTITDGIYNCVIYGNCISISGVAGIIYVIV